MCPEVWMFLIVCLCQQTSRADSNQQCFCPSLTIVWLPVCGRLLLKNKTSESNTIGFTVVFFNYTEIIITYSLYLNFKSVKWSRSITFISSCQYLCCTWITSPDVQQVAADCHWTTFRNWRIFFCKHFSWFILFLFIRKSERKHWEVFKYP